MSFFINSARAEISPFTRVYMARNVIFSRRFTSAIFPVRRKTRGEPHEGRRYTGRKRQDVRAKDRQEKQEGRDSRRCICPRRKRVGGRERERGRQKGHSIYSQGKLSGYLTFIHCRGFLAGAQVHAMQPGCTNFALTLYLSFLALRVVWCTISLYKYSSSSREHDIDIAG